MTLLDQFKAFVDTKSVNTDIDNSAAWNNCAVGKFAEHIGCNDPYLTQFALQVCGGRTELYWLLDKSHFQTYGELQEYLATEV
jgi:hypothetical protein